MLVDDLFNEAILVRSKRRWHKRLVTRGWYPTKVPDEYRNYDVPGYTIDLDIQGSTPLILFWGDRKIAALNAPPDPQKLERLNIPDIKGKIRASD